MPLYTLRFFKFIYSSIYTERCIVQGLIRGVCCNSYLTNFYVTFQIAVLALAAIVAASLDVIPHYSHHGHGHGVSTRYFKKAQGHGYGLGYGGYGGYGLGYGGYGLGYGRNGLGYDGGYGLGYGGYGYGGFGGYGLGYGGYY